MALSDEILARSPLLYVRQADGVDHSGNGLNLTPFNGPTAGASLDLSDPGDPSIAVADGDNLWNPEGYAQLSLSDVVSLFFLFEPSSIGGTPRDLVRKERLYGATLNSDGKVHAVLRVGGVDHDLAGATALTAGVAYSVGLAYDGAELSLYLNGALESTLAVGGAIDVIGSASFTIGTSGVGGYIGLDGLVDEVALYHAALAGGDFAALHAAATTGSSVTGRYSGGANNTSPAASLGGAEGSALGPLFDTPTDTERLAGLTDYRCIYLHAPSEAITGLTAWLAASTPEADTAEAIGADPANPAQTIPAATTAPAGVAFSAPASEGTGIALGDFAAGAAVPLWIRRELDAGAAPGERAFQLGVGWTDAGGAHTTTIDLSYAVIAPVTLYVDADNAARSDAWTRAQAGNDPTKPFATMQAAAMLLQAGDTLQVEPSTLGNANPADTVDPNVYAGITHDPGIPSLNLPAALNGGQEPIRVVGHIPDAGAYPHAGVRPGTRPKVLKLEFTHLENWQFEGFQKGYDRGSGHDHNTVNLLHTCKDVLFTDILSTGGGWYAPGGDGLIHWDHCTTYSPFGGSSGFLDGAGFHVFAADTSTGVIHDVTYRFTNCWFEDIGGEDGIQAGLNPTTNSNLDVLDCTFVNIGQSTVPGAAHADGIQPLGANEVTVARCLFLDVASAFIASDGHVNRITLIDNVMAPGPLGISGNGLQLQGADVAIIAHNTIRSFGFSISVGNRLGPDFVTRLVIVNNLVDTIDISTSDTPVDPTSAFSNNLLLSQGWPTSPWGDNLSGLPELGPSGRLTAAGITANLELANSPTPSAGIGQGRDLAGLGLTTDELGYAAGDYLGRAFATPRDVGAFQSAPSTPITPAARPPYVVDFVPAPGSTADPATSVSARLLPVPGQTIDPATVTTLAAFVADDATGTHLPAVITLGAPDENGYQQVTIDIKASLSPLAEGTLWARVLYDATLDAIKDTQGSQIAHTSWQFRADGPSGPAVTAPASLAAGWTVGTA